MIFIVDTNQTICKECDVSWNASTVFGVMRSLSTLSYIKKMIIDDITYTVLYRNMILKQIPYAPISTRTLSKNIKELVDAGLIISNDNHSIPAYAFTKKADRYISNLNFDKHIDKPDTNKKQPLFELSKPTRISELKPEYYSLLREHCLGMCQKQNIPVGEFDAFVDYHGSMGKKFTNFIRAFGTWCRNYKKFQESSGVKTPKFSNGGESYSLDDEEL